MSVGTVASKFIQGSKIVLPRLAPQVFDYFMVLDFEATCDRHTKVYPQEIIEFPVLLVKASTFDTVSTFHQYVQPKVNKTLSPFCTELTGIIQEMVDGKPHLEEVLEKFDVWIKEQDVLDRRFSFVTFGEWDLQNMLPSQCAYFDIPLPSYFHSWINMKKAFQETCGYWPRGLVDCCRRANLQLIGRQHSGIDDCRNIAALAKWCATEGYTFKTTSVYKKP